MQELLDSGLLMQQQAAEAKPVLRGQPYQNEAGGGCSARRNLNATFTELRRTGQEVAKTELFQARAARHHARQHAGPAGRNLTDLNLPVLRANYVCSENSCFSLFLLNFSPKTTLNIPSLHNVSNTQEVKTTCVVSLETLVLKK